MLNYSDNKTCHFCFIGQYFWSKEGFSLLNLEMAWCGGQAKPCFNKNVAWRQLGDLRGENLCRKGSVITLLSLLTAVLRNEPHGKEKPCYCFHRPNEMKHLRVLQNKNKSSKCNLDPEHFWMNLIVHFFIADNHLEAVTAAATTNRSGWAN